MFNMSAFPPLVDGVVHNRLVQFAPHGDLTFAQLVDFLDSAVVHMYPVLYIFPVLAMLKLLKSVKILQSCSQMYTAAFMNHGKVLIFPGKMRT